MSKKFTLIAAALAAAALGASAVYARQSGAHEDQNEAAALAQAKVSLAQAISIAEQHAKGKAARAELENENGRMVYGVEVLGGGNATDVKVDILSGEVLSAEADRGDHEATENEREGRD